MQTILGIRDIELFIILSWVLVITSGPDLIYVLTKGISNGKKAGFISVLGVTLGILVHTLFAALGLSVILKTSAVAFSIVKYVGAIYLIYLGIKSIVKREKIDISNNSSQKSYKKIFSEELLSNVLNPKVGLFFIAFLPQFIIDNGNRATDSQFLILGSLFAVFGFIFLSLLGYFAGFVKQKFMRSNRIIQWIQVFSGLILVLLGIRLAIVKQK